MNSDQPEPTENHDTCNLDLEESNMELEETKQTESVRHNDTPVEIGRHHLSDKKQHYRYREDGDEDGQCLIGFKKQATKTSPKPTEEADGLRDATEFENSETEENQLVDEGIEYDTVDQEATFLRPKMESSRATSHIPAFNAD